MRSTKWLRAGGRGRPRVFFLLLGLPGSAWGGKPAARKFGPEYVGSETCQACHEDTFKGIMASPHKVADHACESCHGPGADHAGSADATKIRNPLRMTAQQTDRMCLTCHLNQTTHEGRIQSSHMKDT